MKNPHLDKPSGSKQAAKSQQVKKTQTLDEEESQSSSSSGSSRSPTPQNTQPPKLPTTESEVPTEETGNMAMEEEEDYKDHSESGFDPRPTHLQLSRKQARLQASSTSSECCINYSKRGKLVIIVIIVTVLICSALYEHEQN
eukprot:g61233.t1